MKVRLKKKFQPFNESLVATFTSILEESPTKILYDAEKDYLTYQINVETEEDLYEEVMKLHLEEAESENIKEFIFLLLCELPKSNLYLTHILCGSIKKLSNVFGASEVTQISSIKISETSKLPEDVAVLILSNTLNADIPNFKSGIKVKL